MPKDVFVTSPAIWFIPFSQLKATARAAWQAMSAELGTDKPMPQIMTVREFAASLGAVAKQSSDLQLNVGLDRLTAESLLRQAGLGTAPTLVQRLLDAAYQLAPTVAAIRPANRVAWASDHAGLFVQGGQFKVEGAIGFIALQWCVLSSFDTDILWDKALPVLASCEKIYITRGLQCDFLLEALLAGACDTMVEIDLGDTTKFKNVAPLAEYLADDFEDLVQQTAAIILQSKVKDIALVALDRQLVRRVSAVLANRGVALVDETGWALSTSVVAAQLIAWLDALARDAKSDAVLAALKAAPKRFAPEAVSALEVRIRKDGHVQWQQTGCDWLADWPLLFAKSQPLQAWLNSLRELLEYLELWSDWQEDAAGEATLEALFVAGSQGTRLSYAAFVQWTRAVLEASRFKLSWREAAKDETTVTVLPLAQLWGRHFDAVVVPSCDERHLPARPRVQGDWSRAQREALSLLTLDDAASSQAKAWQWLCQQPSVHVLWQRMDGTEMLTKSSLLQLLELEGRLMPSCVMPSLIELMPLSSPRTRDSELADTDSLLRENDESICGNDALKNGVTIDWQTLAPKHLSATGYADLRACPYRFYATRILGLQSFDELDEAVDKRDFGTWLHGTLYRFHESLLHDPKQEREALLDRCASAEQKALRLDDAAFLPFSLIWPKARSAYLAWLAEHEAAGFSYQTGEAYRTYAIDVAGQTTELVGTIDRIDTDAEGNTWLFDYKTESADKTGKRIGKDATEDTQLAFYAALVSSDSVRTEPAQVHAAYINLVERTQDKKGTKMFALPELALRRDALLDGILLDMQKMASGQALRALGEGEACTYCKVRGLCRKDFV